MCMLTGQCSEDMATESNGPVSTSTDNGPLDNNQPWKANSGEDADLTFTFANPAEVTSVQLTDEEADVTFKAYYKTEDGGAFKPYTDEDGQVIVSCKETNENQ